MRISPVPGSTARRNHCALKATERGVPPKCPSAAQVTPAALAASYSSFKARRQPSSAAASLSATTAATRWPM